MLAPRNKRRSIQAVRIEIGSNETENNNAMDVLTPKDRSLLMAKIGRKNTKPELIIRKILHSLGYRFRLHRKDLPGSPDIVLPKYQAVIFVHGCFWHGHNCRKGRKPTSNTDFWNEKLAKNRARDKSNITKLKALGWRCLTIWECQMKDGGKLTGELVAFLKKPIKQKPTTRGLIVDRKRLKSYSRLK